MASFLALLDDYNFDKYSPKIAAGAVLPIASYRSEEEASFAEAISHGGALYLVSVGDDDEIWMVAVLESPERAGLKSSDRRAPGWYAPANTTPVTDLRKLKSKLGLRGALDKALADPLELTAKKEALLRELLGDSDAPVLGVLDVQVAAPKLEGPALARAASYLARGHVDAAIAALAEAWRDSRAPELADLIDRANRVAPGYDRPLFDRRVLAWNDRSPLWDENFASDPVGRLPQLLQGLPVGGDATSERAAKLAELPDDPRLGRRLAELIPSGPGKFNPQPSYWAPIIEIWLRGRDVRLCDTILEGEEEIVGPKAKKLFAYARTPSSYFDGKLPKLSNADRAVCAAIEAELHRLEEPTRIENDLVDAIAANPDDDTARQIYADRLQERGHPRGEYIALSCQKHRVALTPALARRLGALAELPYLCGPLDDLAIRRLRPHDRGIDRRLQVSWNTTAITWFEVASHPLVRALEQIELMGGGETMPGRVGGIAAVARAATKLARIERLGAKVGNQVASKLEGWKLVRGDLVRA